MRKRKLSALALYIQNWPLSLFPKAMHNKYVFIFHLLIFKPIYPFHLYPPSIPFMQSFLRTVGALFAP